MGMGAWNWHLNNNGKGRIPYWFVVYNRRFNAYAVVNTFDGEMMYSQESPTPYGAYDPQEHVICWYIGHFEWSTRLGKMYWLCDMMLDLEISTVITTGWMSLDGLLFKCSGEGHSWLADSIVARFMPNEYDSGYHEGLLEDAGWIRLNYAHPVFMPRNREQLLSVAQIKAIEKLEGDTDHPELAVNLRRLAQSHKRQYERLDASLFKG